jgi:hypothetical protein
MRLIQCISQLLLVVNVAAAAGLHGLFLAAEHATGIVISLDTGLCHTRDELHRALGRDCKELGASRVFGLKGCQQEYGLPIRAALDYLTADTCPLHHSHLQTLVLDEAGSKVNCIEANTKWEHGTEGRLPCILV